MTTPSIERPLVGGRAMRVIRWLFLVALLATPVAFVMEWGGASVIFLVLFAVSTIVVLAPGTLFLVHSIRHRRDGIGREARRSASAFGFVILLLALMTADNEDLRPIAYVLAAVGLIVMMRPWTMSRAADGTPGDYTLPRGRMAIGGLFVAFVAIVVPPKFECVSPEMVGVAQMKTTLRNLVAAQELFFVDSGRFAPSLAALGFNDSAATHAPKLTVGKDWWIATITHRNRRLRDRECVVAIGIANPVSRDTLNQGEPVCRRP